MHTLIGRVNRYDLVQMPLQCRDEHVALLAIELSHSADMGGEISTLDEFGSN